MPSASRRKWLSSSLHCRDIDIAIVTATKLSEQKGMQQPCLCNRRHHIPPNSNSAGGGVGIWAKSSLSIGLISHRNNPEYEILWVSLSLQGGEKIVIDGVYTAPAPAQDMTQDWLYT